MRRRRRWCGLLLLLVLATGCNDSAVGPGVQLGGPAPHIEGTDLDGRPLRLSDLHGQVVLVNFWATWCSPCLEEIPDLVQVAHQFAAQGVQVVGANVDVESPHRLAAFARQHQMTYPVVAATPEVVEAYRLTVIPTTFVIDRQGVIRKRYLGPRGRATFAHDINELLKEAATSHKQGGA